MIDKLAWLTFKDQQLLCARSHGKHIYYIPGGKREAGESDEAALMREIEEELAVALKPTPWRLPASSVPRPTASRRGSTSGFAATPARLTALPSPRRRSPSCAGSTAAIWPRSLRFPGCCLPGWSNRSSSAKGNSPGGRDRAHPASDNDLKLAAETASLASHPAAGPVGGRRRGRPGRRRELR